MILFSWHNPANNVCGSAIDISDHWMSHPVIIASTYVGWIKGSVSDSCSKIF